MRLSLYLGTFLFTSCTLAPVESDLPYSSTLVTVHGAGHLAAANVDEGTVSFVDPTRGVVAEIDVGGEPTRLTSHGTQVWVTARLDGEVVALDVADGRPVVTGRRTVGSEPYGIVANPEGTRLYVAVSLDSAVLELDATTLETIRSFPTIGEPRWLAIHPTGRTLAVAMATGHEVVIMQLETETEPVRVGLSDTPDYRATGAPAFNPAGNRLAVPAVLLRDPLGLPARYYADNRVVLPGTATLSVDPTTGSVDDEEPAWVPHGGGYATHIAWRDNEHTILSLEGAAMVYVTVPLLDAEALTWVGKGPRGLARVDRRWWVHAAFENSIVPVSDPEAQIQISEPRLSPSIRRGRDLFYDAVESDIGSGGISCASCHFEGRSDNRTWELSTGRWQTPSLGGDVDATAPVSWAQNVPSVADEAQLTSTGPMGGDGLADFDALAAFVNQVRLPNPPTPTASAEVLELGRAAFTKAGCQVCHPAPLYTDNLHHPMFGQDAVQTPSLLGIASTAPYLHDGRARDLSDLLTQASGEMGEPETLSQPERAALIQWLRSL